MIVTNNRDMELMCEDVKIGFVCTICTVCNHELMSTAIMDTN